VSGSDVVPEIGPGSTSDGADDAPAPKPPPSPATCRGPHEPCHHYCRCSRCCVGSRPWLCCSHAQPPSPAAWPAGGWPSCWPTA
jgi:hypothetical protein